MWSIIKTLFAVFLHAFHRRTTVQYPEVKPRLPARWRGRIVLTRDPSGDERCVACYLCAVACPVDCIALQAAEREDGRRYPALFRINFSRCIFCGFCEEACPTYAIQLTPDFEMGEWRRQHLVYEKEDLRSTGPASTTTTISTGRRRCDRRQGGGRGDWKRAARRTSEASCHEGRQINGHYAFYIPAAVAIAATFMVVTSGNAIHALPLLRRLAPCRGRRASRRARPLPRRLKSLFTQAPSWSSSFSSVMISGRGPHSRRTEPPRQPGSGPASSAAILAVELAYLEAKGGACNGRGRGCTGSGRARP